MTGIPIQFNAAQVDPTMAGALFESGEYTFQITSSDVKPTKNNDGTMLIFDFKCLDQHALGRRLQVRLNVQNKNPTAVEIAYKELSAICHVCGVLDLQNTQQLFGVPFKAEIEKVERNDKPGQFSNNVIDYRDMAGNAPVKGVPGQTSAGHAPPQMHAPQQPPQQAAPQQQAPAPQPPAAPPQQAAPPAAPPPAPPAAPGGFAPPAGFPNGAAAAPPAAPWGGGQPAGAPPWNQPT